MAKEKTKGVSFAVKMTLIHAAVVGLGGFFGVLARYGLVSIIHRQLPLATFPYGTLVINLLGCFAVGLMAGLAESRQLFGPEFRMFIIIGFLGGFTTFSTLGHETFLMLREANYFRALANVGLHVVLGLALVWLGILVTGSR